MTRLRKRGKLGQEPNMTMVARRPAVIPRPAVFYAGDTTLGDLGQDCCSQVLQTIEIIQVQPL
jgi:hypothetical protein